MTLSEFERRIKRENPRLHVKRYGTSMAAVHYGNEHVCRVPQGEIAYHNLTEERIGYAQHMMTAVNQTGKYSYQFLVRRGRYDTARIIAGKGLVPWAAVPRIAN